MRGCRPSVITVEWWIMKSNDVLAGLFDAEILHCKMHGCSIASKYPEFPVSRFGPDLQGVVPDQRQLEKFQVVLVSSRRHPAAPAPAHQHAQPSMALQLPSAHTGVGVGVDQWQASHSLLAVPPTVHTKEKEGGNRPASREITQFRSMVESCELIDLPTHGPQFTWSNKRQGGANITIKLDRALANHAWRTTFPDTAVLVQAALNSDHCPLIIDSEGGKFKGQRPFRFKSIWFRHLECKQTAMTAWAPVATTDATPILFKKMQRCKLIFKRWNKEVFGHVQTKIQNLKGELEDLQGGPIFDGYYSKEQELSMLLNEELEKEEELWRQKSRAYYSNIFQFEGIDHDALQLVLESIQPQISPEVNEALCGIPILEEMQAALTAMAPLKALGPNGLPPAFFQKFWDFTHSDVYDFVCNFFSSGTLPLHCNDTYLCLVPKCSNPESADQYRPISLCAVAVKIISKIMANKLKEALEILISPAQSAFIPGRSISDNIFVAHEVFNYIIRKKKGKQKFLALKLDMRKAYDLVEWEFIEQLLLRFGFASHWVNMVMACLRSVTYRLVINGAVRGCVIPSRGIRQGDQLSPALFILCSQALSSVLEEVYHLKQCLEVYCNASGQAINLKKSTLSFIPNVHVRFRRWFSRVLKIPYGKGPSKYLGLPTIFGTSKAELFHDITDKAGKRFNGWKNRLLSHVGKERGGIGFLLRNHLGQLRLAVSSHHRFSFVIEGEAIAVREGLLEAILEGTYCVMVESDNREFVSYHQDCSKQRPLSICPIVEDIRHIATYLDVCQFLFIPRDANVVADSLARRAQSIANRTVWPNSDPCISVDAVTEDLSLIR
ncbi:uncharacterized protein LOC122665818 [Telopea speciosissima]|uniref:uncharacterized protein LOC122665818 n=1 Tax=Telopea speciosissima TaxID=54955 RepID=UPI001CC68164|nr:uncharacterized protein LOC122665818 [Telopea speciosissima]